MQLFSRSLSLLVCSFYSFFCSLGVVDRVCFVVSSISRSYLLRTPLFTFRSVGVCFVCSSISRSYLFRTPLFTYRSVGVVDRVVDGVCFVVSSFSRSYLLRTPVFTFTSVGVVDGVCFV